MVVNLAQRTAVHQVTEELPTGGDFITADVVLLGNDINRGGSGHGASRSLHMRGGSSTHGEAVLEVGNTTAISSNHRKRIRRRNKELLA